MTFRKFGVALALLLGAAGTAAAQTSATATVGYAVTDVKTIAVSGSPTATLTVGAGGSNSSVSDSTTTYDVTASADTVGGKKITAAIDSTMPTGVTLSVRLADPDGTGGAASAGVKALGTTAVDVVTGINGVQATNNKIVYTLAATASATATSGQRTVTFTIQ